MSGLTRAETSDLFDPLTGAYYGVTDLRGNETQLVTSALLAKSGPVMSNIERRGTGITSAAISPGGLQATNTWQYVISTLAKAYRFRMGYINYGPAQLAYTVDKTTITPSSTFALTDPTVGTPISVTFGGLPAATVLAGPSATEERITWSDWITIAPVDRTDDVGGYSLFFIRSFLNQNGGYPYNSLGTGFPGNTATTLIRQGCGWASGDKIASPVGFAGVANNSLQMVFEFEEAANVFSVGGLGDSLTSGVAPLNIPWAVGEQAVNLLNAKGTLTQFSYVNYGIGATSSPAFMKRLPALLSGQKLDALIFSVDSPNSPVATQAAYDAQLDRNLNAINQCLAAGVVPIVWCSTPHSDTGLTESFRIQTTNFWRAQAAANPALIFVDTDVLTSDGAASAGWKTGFSDDGLHWNQVGATAVAPSFAAAIVQATKQSIVGRRPLAMAVGANAAPGYVGEVVQSTIAVGAAVALTTATPANVTSISLTPGDWDLSAAVDFGLTAASATSAKSGISLTSATLPAQAGGSGLSSDSGAAAILLTTVLSDTLIQPSGPVRLSVVAQTTVYLVAQATFSAGSVAAYGTLRARRAPTI